MPSADLVAAARAAWPGVAFVEAEVLPYVAERLPEDGSAERAVELCLAWACARGDAAAIAHFQRVYFPQIDAAGRRARAPEAIAADARQNLARSLFTGASPAILGFRGRGDLGGWMRVAAMREVLRLQKAGKRDVLVDDDRFLDAIAPAGDPELGYLRKMFRSELTSAFQRAIAGLTEEQRELLRRQLAGTTIDELAAELGIHRATAARRLAAARDAVLEGTRKELAQSLGAVSADADSLLKLVSGRLDVSLDRLLAPE